MSKDLDLSWLDADTPTQEIRSDKKPKPEKKEKSPSANQVKKLRQENKELKQKYDSLKHHELSEVNMINYFMGIKQAKLYELVRFFDLNAAHEIEKLLKDLRKKGFIKYHKDGWHRINPYYKKQMELDKIEKM